MRDKVPDDETIKFAWELLDTGDALEAARMIEARDTAIRQVQARADAAIVREAANAARSYGWTDRGDDLLRLAESIECRAGLPPAAGEEGK